MDNQIIDAPAESELQTRGFDDLFAEHNPARWLVLHVKSRQEKALSNDLAAMSVQHYLPVTTERRIHAGRKVSVQVPVFPGYLFLRGSLDEAYRADRTRRVANIIHVADQIGLNAELFNFRLAIQNNVPLLNHAWLMNGVEVEIIAGPLMGLKGLVEDRHCLDRVILRVNILGRAVSIEVDSSCVAAID
jgi:transcription antitermination factor NusG